MPDTTDLYTVVKNTSGKSLYFGFLGPRGQTLAADATYTVFGNLQDSRNWNRRKQLGLEKALEKGLITIIKSPVPIIADTSPTAPLANPVTMATNTTTTGGDLPLGYYKTAYTIVNTWGETTIGSSLSAAIQVANTTNDRIVVTTPSPNSITGATAINIYITAPAATAAGVDPATLRKVGTITGATTTFNIDNVPAVSPTNPLVPQVNTTGGPSSHGLTVTAGMVDVKDPSWGRVY